MAEPRSYYEIVDQAFESEHKRLISNGQPEHAAYLVRKFFEGAERHIRLFSGHLKRNVDDVPMFSSPDIIKAAKGFLRKPGAMLDIVLAGGIDVSEGGEPEDHPLLAAIRYESNWGFLRGTLTLSMAGEVDKGFQHFLLMDDRAVRVETDSEKVKAIVAFGDDALCSAAAGKFGQIVDRAQRVLAIH